MSQTPEGNWTVMKPAATTVQALGEWRQDSRAGLAEQLANAIEGALLDGRLSLAAPLPSERAMANSLGVSRATVTAAYGALKERGWLATRRGARGVPVIPAELNEGLSPRDGALPGSEEIDLTLAAPAAPAQPYLEAVERAQRQLAGRLATTGLVGHGLPELKERLAERHTRAGLPTRPEQILITAGALPALHLALTTVPARAAALTELPTYPGALDVLRERGRPVIGWPVHEGWDADQFEDLAQRRAVRVSYVMPDFHNPTGKLVPEAERTAVASAAAKRGVLLIVDETMRELDLRSRPCPEPPLAALMPSAITLGSFSKVLWGGLRVGWLRAQSSLVAQLETHPLRRTVTPPLLEQTIALELVDELEGLIKARRSTLRKRRDHVFKAVEAMDGISPSSPDGGLSMWTTLHGVSSRQLVTDALPAGVRLQPGGRFSPDAPLDNHLRIPFTLPLARLDQALSRLEPLLATGALRLAG